MGKQPASLPEDRSEWPSFLSGGSLPKVEPAVGASVPSTSTSTSSIPSPSSLAPSSGLSSATSTSDLSHYPTTSSTTPTHSIHPISSSVPNPQPSGPRLHDYPLKAPGGKVVVTQVKPGLLLGVNNDDSHVKVSASAYPMSMPAQQFTSPRIPLHHHNHGYSYDYGYAPVVPTPMLPGENGVMGNNHSNPTWSLPNSSMRSHGRSLSSQSGSVSAQSEDDIDIEDEGEEYGRGRVLMRNGGGIDVEGDADSMDNDDEDDEHYEGYNNHGDEHHDNDDEDDGEEEETQTQNEMYTRHTTRYNAPRMDISVASVPQHIRWDGDMDIEMDMDMD